MLNASYYLYSKKDEMSSLVENLRKIYGFRIKDIVKVLKEVKFHVLNNNYPQSKIKDFEPLQPYFHDICDSKEKDYIKNLMSVMKLKTSYNGLKFHYVFPNYHGKQKGKKKSGNESAETLYASHKDLRERYYWGLKFQLIANWEEIESLNLDFENWKALCEFILLKMNVFINDNRFKINEENIVFRDNPVDLEFGWIDYWPITKVIRYGIPWENLYKALYENSNYNIMDKDNNVVVLTKNYKYDRKMERFSKEEILDIIQQSNSNRIKDIANGYNISHPDKLPLSEELLRYYIKKHELTSLVSMRVRKTKEKNK